MQQTTLKVNQLKPYPKYKDSGVEWLGDVPEGWEVRRIKTLLDQRNDKGFANEPLLAATQTKGVVRKEKYENRTVVAQNDLHLLKLVKKNDFVISLRSFQGGIERAHDQGIISPAYTILSAKKKENLGYFTLLFKSNPFIANLKLYVTGIREGQNIDYVKLSRSYLPTPAQNDQVAVVRYLNYTNSRITKFIGAKKQLIKLLEEQKQAIIHQAVTGAIDVRTGKPYSKYKDSGIEWLGQIPEEWEVDKLKRSISQCVNGIWGNDPDKENDIFCVRVADFNYKLKQVQLDKMTFRSITNNERVGRLLKEGDLLLEKSGGGDLQPVGRVVIYNHDIPAVCSNFIAKVRISKKYNAMFICYLHSLLYSVGLNIRSIKQTTGIQNLDSRSYFNEVVAYPSLQEQFAISQFIENKLGKIYSTIDRTKKEIVLLKEYRTRLIADVVTGKVDVREVAKNLPEETDTSLELVDDVVEESNSDEQLEPANEEN